MLSTQHSFSALLLLATVAFVRIVYAEDTRGDSPWSIGTPLDQHACAIELPLPAFPSVEKQEARKAVVSVLLKIDETGVAEVVRAMSSSSYRFSDAAKQAAAKWKFKPGRKDGKKSADLLEFILYFDPAKDVEIVGPLYE